LKCELVVGVKNVEGERGLRLLKGCGVPAYPQELAIPLDPPGILRARTKLHVDTVNSVGVDHENDLSFRI
jgi:hypothetical protein